MKEPNVKFSCWKQWNERNSLSDIDFPGVYLLAHFDNAPDGSADPQDKQIIYFGETCNNSLKGRLQQFHRSAFEGKEQHSGGITYREKFGGKGDNLYVAAFPEKILDKEIRSFFIRYIERKLIWEYTHKYNERSKCNRK